MLPDKSVLYHTGQQTLQKATAFGVREIGRRVSVSGNRPRYRRRVMRAVMRADATGGAMWRAGAGAGQGAASGVRLLDAEGS